MKKKAKFIIAGTSVAVIAAAVGGTIMLTSATDKVDEGMPMPETVAVERMDLANKVTLSGTVKSGSVTSVKSGLSNIKIKEVKVKVGDRVKKGDVIAVLDDTELREKLDEAEKAYKNSKAKKEIDISAADRSYESTMSSADKSVKEAEKSLKDAQKAYDEAYNEDNKIYKEYLEAVEKKNKAYDEYKPYESKVKSDDGKAKEKVYAEACEKLAKKEALLSEAAEALALKESTLKEAGSRFEAAREELNKQIELKRAAEAKLYQAQAEDAEEAGASDAGDMETMIGSFDSTISAAEKMLKETEIVLRDAQTAYDSAAKEYNKVSEEYLKANDEKNAAYDKYRSHLGKLKPDEADEKEKAYNEAKEKAEEKEKELKDANKKFEDARDELNKQKELKQETEDKAAKDRADIEGTYETTKMTADDSLSADEKEIKKIKENIEKCTITAEADGIITYLAVKEGETFVGGEAAVIMDDGSYIISANADQYEISGIESGMKTRIIANALDGSEMEGSISFAALTPETKDGQEGQSIEYPVESQIDSPDERLRFGMKVKLEVISEEKSGVLAVPDECIQINENGEYYVEAVDDAGNRSQIVVDYGMKSDYYSEIEGSGLEEGMLVVKPEEQMDDDFGDMILF